MYCTVSPLGKPGGGDLALSALCPPPICPWRRCPCHRSSSSGMSPLLPWSSAPGMSPALGPIHTNLVKTMKTMGCGKKLFSCHLTGGFKEMTYSNWYSHKLKLIKVKSYDQKLHWYPQNSNTNYQILLLNFQVICEGQLAQFLRFFVLSTIFASLSGLTNRHDSHHQLSMTPKPDQNLTQTAGQL